MPTTACSSSSRRPGTSRIDRDAASPIMLCHSPATTTATSAASAMLTARRNSASASKPRGPPAGCGRTCRTSRQTPAGPPGCQVPTPPAPGPRPCAGCRRARSPSRPGRSRTPRGRGCRGESASGPITATDRARRGSSGNRSPWLRSRTAGCSAATRATFVPRIGQHLAGAVLVDIGVVEQPQPQLGLQDPPHAGVEHALADRPDPERLGQVGVGDPGWPSPGRPGGQRPGGGVGQIRGEAVGDQVADRASLTTNPPKPHAWRSTSVNSHRLAEAGRR